MLMNGKIKSTKPILKQFIPEEFVFWLLNMVLYNNCIAKGGKTKGKRSVQNLKILCRRWLINKITYAVTVLSYTLFSFE